MFKIDDCFKSCSIFNEILIKRFEDNFIHQNGSRLWMTPGHIVFTTDHTKVHTCDARPYDFSSSPSEPDSDELLIAIAPVLDIYFDTETTSTRMFIVLNNGDIQIFEYRVLLYEWARIGYFNLNITSPNTNNNHHLTVTQVLVSHYQNMIYWSEQSESSENSFNLYKREVPLNGVREITQSAVGATQKILKNCPRFEIFEIRDNICIVPTLPNAIHFYLILSTRSHLWLFNINGKCLFRGTVCDNPVDFISLCAKTVGLWTQGGVLKVCHNLENTKNKGFILHNEVLLSISFTGEIFNSTKIDIISNTENFCNCFIIHNSLFSFSDNFEHLYIFNIEDGKLIQAIDLLEKAPIKGLWCHSSNIPSIGFYTEDMIYKVNFKSLRSILNSEPACFTHALTILKQEFFHVFTLLKYSVLQKFEKSDFPPLKDVPTVLQSEALLLAILHSCYERGYRNQNFPLSESAMTNILNPENFASLKETTLRENLQPLVECFLKTEKSKRLLLSNTGTVRDT